MAIYWSEFTKRAKAVEQYIDTMTVMKVMKENGGKERVMDWAISFKQRYADLRALSVASGACRNHMINGVPGISSCGPRNHTHSFGLVLLVWGAGKQWRERLERSR
jgi:hypothetical protein